MECGTHQLKSLGVCRLCDEPLPAGEENPLSALVWEKEATSVEDLVRENEELRQIHWGWRLEQVPVGEGEGRLRVLDGVLADTTSY